MYLSAAAAAADLGVSLPTLYSYVSRGLIRSEQTAGSKRARRYHAEDIALLKRRKQARRAPETVVSGALRWGAPLLESAITLIADGRLYYRGQDAMRLAAERRVEQVAALIWLGSFEGDEIPWDAVLPPPQRTRLQPLYGQLPQLAPLDAFQLLLPLLASDDLSGYDLRPAAVARTGARILGEMALLAAAFGQSRPPDEPAESIAQRLQRSWAPAEPAVADLFNRALILCADHELNGSSFTARCVASAGASPYAVVAAGLAAFRGARHGGNVDRVELFLHELEGAADPARRIAQLVQWGDPIPGFGHPLYPGGDPRAAALLELVTRLHPEAPAVRIAQLLEQQVAALRGDHANVDLSLAVLGRALAFPPGRGAALFALGRTIGWIGHAIEQYGSGTLIRPRARYVGPPPSEGEQ